MFRTGIIMIRALLILAAVTAVIYILYINGFITVGNKKAMLLIIKNSYFNKSCSAKFAACTGEIKRVVKFKESREYTFNYDCKLEKGEVRLTLADSKKRQIFTLTPENNTATVNAAAGERYYLKFEFYKAYGNYNLTWK